MKPICYDFQGWPINALTFRDILKQLNVFEEKDGKLSIDIDNPILDSYPRILHDDGMGYGVEPELITLADNETYDTKINVLDVKVPENYDDLCNLDKIKDIIHEETITVFNLFADREPSSGEDEPDIF